MEKEHTYSQHHVTTNDGKRLSLSRLYSSSESNPEPVLLVHGAGVRSKIFSPPRDTGPDAENIDELLASKGFDVWKLDWRASIDQEPNTWTLDEAAVLDYPATVKYILQQTDKDSIKALVHCQGSTSFMLSLVAGLLPEVSTVVSNAVSLHPVVPRLAYYKALYGVPVLKHLLTYVNPQWGIHAPSGWPKVLDYFVRATHHECNNPVCKWSSFVYGAGFPTLWSHENLDDVTHHWLQGEFAHVPMSFFSQMSRSIKAGHILTTGRYQELPDSVVEQAPKTDARIVLLAGEFNDCFTPESQKRSFDFLDGHAPGRHSFYQLSGYGHLDVFIGKDAPRDIFPLIVDELSRN